MGTACVLNAKRCARTHCRYTGPYYLAMIAPVLALGSGILEADFLGWLVLAVIILVGSKLICGDRTSVGEILRLKTG
jgi:hypothetical protein